MDIPEAKVKFTVGLSNGENLVEGIGPLEKTSNEDSSWWKLQKYIKDKGVKITSMSLISKTEIGNRHYHLPNKINKFNGEVPIGYDCFRYYGGDALGTVDFQEYYTCIEAIYSDCRVQLWVSELDNDKVWVNLVRQKSSE